jgi:hypothetical protein
LEYDLPIPSCEIHSLRYDGGKWVFAYAVNTPVEITNSNKQDLIVYEYISDLIVRIGDGQHPDAVNIHFKTLDEYMLLLEAQRTADLEFRRKWLEKEKNQGKCVKKFAMRTLENRDYSFKELREENVHFISFLMEDNGVSSIFAAV